MHLSRIQIENFRNFSHLDVELSGNVVVVGENLVGKSNLLYALRLVLDASLPDAARQLSIGDFWDGLKPRGANHKISVSIEITQFDSDPNVLVVLKNFCLNDDPSTARLTFKFRPKPDLGHEPETDADYEFICYGGEDESLRFGHEVRRRITLDVLPALRDAGEDLISWNKSPLYPLVKNTGIFIRSYDLAAAIELAASPITSFEAVQILEKNIADLFLKMGGESQNVNPKLGLSPTDTSRLHQNIQLLIDDGLWRISDANLRSTNRLPLPTKTLDIRQLIENNNRDHTFLAIEEPEAHLHPYLQRSVYRHLFKSVEEDDDRPLSIFLTTHSPHIASVTPIRSIVLLRNTKKSGTTGQSASSIPLDDSDVEDLQRYLDVNRGGILFSRGVILVEGDAERILVPVIAKTMSLNLDSLGISVCSVSGVNFKPYAKFLTGLGIPFSVVTDWDPQKNGAPLGKNRAQDLIRTIKEVRSGEISEEPEETLSNIDEEALRELSEKYGIFFNLNTLDVKRYLSLTEEIGKDPFAQRLTGRLKGVKQLGYISAAIEFVVGRV